MSEKAITTAIIRYFQRRPDAHAEKVFSGGGFAHAGKPDVDACVAGRAVKLEVKVPGGQATRLQSKRLRDWREAGAVAEVVSSVEQVVEVLSREGLAEGGAEAAAPPSDGGAHRDSGGQGTRGR